MKKHYFAYGSNLSLEQMKRRCPDAVPVGTGRIEDYELLFRGSKTGSYLTIEPKAGSYVPVLAWEVSLDDRDSLDRYEGYPVFYTREYFEVMIKPLAGGKEYRQLGFAYVMDSRNTLGRPTDYYYDICREGYQRFGFDERLLEQAIYRSAVKPKSFFEGFSEVNTR